MSENLDRLRAVKRSLWEAVTLVWTTQDDAGDRHHLNRLAEEIERAVNHVDYAIDEEEQSQQSTPIS